VKENRFFIPESAETKLVEVRVRVPTVWRELLMLEGLAKGGSLSEVVRAIIHEHLAAAAPSAFEILPEKTLKIGTESLDS